MANERGGSTSSDPKVHRDSAGARPGLLVVTALPEELTPLLAVFGARPVPPAASGESERYYEAEVRVTGSRVLRVILASAYGKGVGNMTALVSAALQRWRPRHAILAGIAAAVPDGKSALGTVLAATTIVDATENKVKPASRSTRHRSYECDVDLLTPLRCFAGDGPGARARFGIVICQPDVVKYAVYREELVKPVSVFFDERPIGLEMEGAGLAIGVRRRPAIDRPGFGLVKGAVDFASFRKNDAHRRAATAEVARLLFEFIELGWLGSDPQPPRPESPEADGNPSPQPPPPALYGRDASIAELKDELVDPTGARIISIEGLGGIGKTALATRIISEAAARNLHSRIGRLTIASTEENPFRRAALVSTLAAQFGFHEVNELQGQAAEASLLARLSNEAHVVLVDNLELPADAAELGRLLASVDPAAATRWIVTSRPALPASIAGVRTLLLEELHREDAIALLRVSLKDQEFGAVAVDEEDLDAVYGVIGGNPQALKLSAGLLKRYPTSIVVALLTKGQDEADEFYRDIYGTSWGLLSDLARTTLVALRFLPEDGGDWERLRAVSGLETDELIRSIRELLDLNLVMVSRGGGTALYSLHRLTATFVGDVMKSWGEAERSEAVRSFRRRNIEHTRERMRRHERYE
jgi:hypothetical protein